jgi:hypothetical protein
VSVNASILDGAIESTTGPAWDGSQFIWWVNQIAPYLDGIAEEHWQQNWDSSDSVRVSGSSASQAWDGWQRVVSAVEAAGKDFFPIGMGALNDVQKAMYLRASFLLAWKPGRGAFFYTDDYDGKGDPWRRVALPRIGHPLEPRRRVGVGYQRTFMGGSVIVNPSPTQSQSFAFRQAYVLPSGTVTRSVTLRPASGLILRRASGR